jgi:Hemopexin
MGTKVYFFKGDKYARFDRGEDRFDQQPRETRLDEKWIGLHQTGFAHKIDAAVRWNNGFIYFFQGDEYIRFRIRDNPVDLPRRKIREGWPGMHETGFAHKIDAAINYDNGKAYFFQGKTM